MGVNANLLTVTSWTNKESRREGKRVSERELMIKMRKDDQNRTEGVKMVFWKTAKKNKRSSHDH